MLPWLAVSAHATDTDALTVTSIALTTYTTAALVHEGLGHELGCVIGGGRPTGFSVANADCAGLETPGGHRWLEAGGSTANLAAGIGFGGALWAAPPKDGAAYYHLWLQTIVNLQQAGGYLMVGPWVPVGDWGTEGFLRDVRHPLPAQLALSTAGAALTFATVPLANGLGKPLFGGDRKRGLTLALVPWLGGSTMVVTGSLLNRAGPQYAATAAASTLFGTVFLAYVPLLFHDDVFVPGRPWEGEHLAISRQPGWWVVGGLAAVSAVAVFGPGLGDYPRPHPLDPR